jgi:hypothetical protein
LALLRQEATSATEPLRKHFATIGLEIMEKANLNGLRVKKSAIEMLIDFYRNNPINGKYLISPARSGQEAAQMDISNFMTPQEASNLIKDRKTIQLVPIGVHGLNKHIGGTNIVKFVPGVQQRVKQWEEFINTGISKKV